MPLFGQVAGLGVVDVQFVDNAVLAGVMCLCRCSRWPGSAAKSRWTIWRGRGWWCAGSGRSGGRAFARLPEFVGDYGRRTLGSFALGLGGAFDFGAVFVGAGGEDDVVALHAFEARDGFRGDGGVGVPDVRRGVT